jgi:hypothetical protein
MLQLNRVWPLEYAVVISKWRGAKIQRGRGYLTLEHEWASMSERTSGGTWRLESADINSLLISAVRT